MIGSSYVNLRCPKIGMQVGAGMRMVNGRPASTRGHRDWHDWVSAEDRRMMGSSRLRRLGSVRGSGRRDFVIRCSREVFSEDEIEILEKYGAAFHRLAEGHRLPQTDAQKRFVDAVHEVRETETEYEETWLKYVRRLAWESDPENRAAMGPRRKAFNDRDDWRRMAGAQWGETIRRARGFDD